MSITTPAVPVALPLRVERDPASSVKFRLYDDTGCAVRVGEEGVDPVAVPPDSSDYTTWTDYNLAAEARDNINRAGSWEPSILRSMKRSAA